MIIDLETEEGKIIAGLASIGAMMVGVNLFNAERANQEIPHAVLIFQSTFAARKVRAAIEKVAVWASGTSLS